MSAATPEALAEVESYALFWRALERITEEIRQNERTRIYEAIMAEPIPEMLPPEAARWWKVGRATAARRANEDVR